MALGIVVRRLPHYLVAVVLTLASAWARADGVRPLRVGVATGYEPVVYKVSGELQGIEIDFARIVAKRLQRPLVFKEYEFKDLIPALEANKIDVIMSGMSITKARSRLVRFTDPYMDVGQMAIVRTTDASVYGEPNALLKEGLKVGVQKGTTGEAYVRKHLLRADVHLYANADKGLDALRSGGIDVFIHDSTTSWQLGRSFINDKLMSLSRFLTSESLAWAVNRDQPELQTTLNLVLKDMKEHGEVRAVVKRWLPVVPASL